MVHLRALPGSPRWDGDMPALVRAALDDARALAEGGADALLVENHGDVPFTARRVDAATVAGMAVAVAEIRRALPLPVGVNVLKNDVRSALAVAAATGARFVRVNVHVGAVAADQGIIESDAHDTLRYRRLLGLEIGILADVQAKHGLPLAPMPLEQEARDCYARGLADALVVSGVATGEPTPMADLKRVRGAVPEAPLLVGSGASPETVGRAPLGGRRGHRRHLDQARRAALEPGGRRARAPPRRGRPRRARLMSPLSLPEGEAGVRVPGSASAPSSPPSRSRGAP